MLTLERVMDKRRVLIIDDSLTIRALLQQVFINDNFVDVVGIASSGEEGIDLIRRLRPDVVTLDITLPGIDGFAVLDVIMDKYQTAVIIIASSAHIKSEICERALNSGAFACFDKAHVVSQAKKLRSVLLLARRTKIRVPDA